MDIPCNECITFPVCKQQIRVTTRPADTVAFSKMKNCKLFLYLIDPKKADKRIPAVRELFGLPISRKVGSNDFNVNVIQAYNGESFMYTFGESEYAWLSVENISKIKNKDTR